MSAKWFICPNGDRIEISSCIERGGCPFPERCATLPFLRLVGYDREFNGVSPSMAGTGPRMIWLKATIPYAIDPQSRVWSAFGIGTHEKLSMHRYVHNVLSEEKMSDSSMSGIADVLEEDEKQEGYIQTDYKTFGSYKVAQCLGLKITYEPILDQDGKEIKYASGQKKGQKT
jgi:hypothetical protein